MRHAWIRIALIVSVGLTTFTSAQGQDWLRTPGRLPKLMLPRRNSPARTEAEQAFARGDYEKVIQSTSTLLAINRADHVAYYLRASARVELGRSRGDAGLIREGINDAREAIRVSSNVDVNYFLPYLAGMTALAEIEKKPAHAEIAVSVATQTLRKPMLSTTQKANLLYQRAAGQVVLKKFTEAAKDYRDAIDQDSSHIGAYLGLADAYAAAGQGDKAVQAFQNAAKQFPTSPLVFNNSGMYYQSQGRLEEAITEFTRAINVAPNYAIALTNRGFAETELGQLQAAEIDYTNALRLEDQASVRSLRGTTRLAQGNTAGAIEDYSHVVQQDPSNALAHADLGFAHFFAKDYAAARQEFNRALERDPKSRYLVPWCYWTMLLEGSEQAARQRFPNWPDPKVAERDWVDHLFAFLTGSLSQEDLLAKVDSKDAPLGQAQTCEAHYFIGQVQERAGDAEAAKAHYRLVLKTDVRHLSAFRGAQFALQEFQLPVRKTPTHP